MKKSVLIILLLISALASRSQTKLDSLCVACQREDLEDTARMNALYHICYDYYLFNDPDTALLLVHQLYDKAVDAKMPKYQADALLLEGIIHIMKGSHDIAIEKFNESLALRDKKKEKYDIGRTYSNLGDVYGIMGDFVRSQKYLSQAVAIFEEIGNNLGLAHTEMTIGRNHYDQGEYSLSLDYMMRSLKLFEGLGDKQGTASSMTFIASIYWVIEEYSKAQVYQEHAIKLMLQVEYKAGLIGAYTMAGKLHKALGQYDEALADYDRAATCATEMGIKDGVAKTLTNIGAVYMAQGDYARALEYFNISLQQKQDLGPEAELEWTMVKLGQVYQAKGNMQKALEWCQKGLDLSQERGRKLTQREACDCLYESYKTLNLNQKALGYLEMSINLDRSIRSREAINKLQKFELSRLIIADSLAQVQRELKMDIAHQAEIHQKDLTRNILITSGLIFLILIGGLWSRLSYIRRTKARLEKEKNRAERSEKFKQQFLANMSHEIRTPMNAVLGMTNLTLDTHLTTKQQDYLKAIKNSSESLLVIINDVLDLSKLEAGKMDLESIPFRLKEQIEQAHNTLRFKAEEKGLLFKTSIADDVPEVLVGDPSRLIQILLNLAGNAIKFTERGMVGITVERVPDTKATLRFRVTDTGIGIAKEKLDCLFNAFQQLDASTSRRFGGTGLGLAICATLVELQSGRIEVSSEVGVGSEFNFTIPYSVASKQELTDLENLDKTDHRALRGIRVLVVEDNEYNRIVIHDTLEHLIDDVSIDVAINGKMALELHEKKDYDLILMDVQMPEMDGLEATRIIRGQMSGDKKEIPIIALTASVLSTDIQKCFDAGMDAYVPKPFKREQLTSTMLRFYRSEIPNKEMTMSENNGKATRIVEYMAPVEGQVTDLTFLWGFCDGDEQRMKKYVDMYLGETKESLGKIKQALKKEDYKTLKTIIHSMKPHLSFMGMTQTRTVAEEIEHIIAEGKVGDRLGELVSTLDDSCRKSLRELR